MRWRLPRFASLCVLFLLLTLAGAKLTEKEKRETEKAVRTKTKKQLEEILEHMKMKPRPGATKEDMQLQCLESGYMIY